MYPPRAMMKTHVTTDDWRSLQQDADLQYRLMSRRPTAATVLLRKVGDVWQTLLVQSRKSSDQSFVQGKIERGEHPIHAACREIGEEVGIYDLQSIGGPLLIANSSSRRGRG